MSLLYFRIDQNEVQKFLDERIGAVPEVQIKATQIAVNLFGRSHQSLMRDFLEHPVTQELKAGPEAQNISNTLNGEGNLFGFLGFWVGQDPTLELEDLFLRMSIEKSSTKRNIIYYKINNYPTSEAIKDVTQMNWGNGQSWAFAIENGDFGGSAALSHYIFKEWAGSRSSAGFQIPVEYSEESFNPTPYLSEILENFRNRINNSNSKFLA